MEKYFIYLIGFIPFTFAYAQIPNNNFETWSAGSPAEIPANWMTTNNIYNTIDLMTSSSHPTSVVKTSPGYTGNFAITLKNVSGKFSGYNIDTLPGMAEATTAAGKAGFPIAKRYNMLSGYYTFIQGGTGSKIDTANIVITVSIWNEGTKSREIIGKGQLNITDNTSSFAIFNILINYTSAASPDSAQIVMVSSKTKIRYPGTTLTIDDLNLNGTTNSGATGLKNIVLSDMVTAYPNPAINEINIKNIPDEAQVIELRDITGKKIRSSQVDSDEAIINTNTIPSGMYIYSIINKSGEVIWVNKISIQN